MASSALANRRSVMNLFSAPECPYCHRARIVLAEKDITFETIDVNLDKLPEDLLELNPYNTVPTLIDRDLVLYDSRVIVEYLDERFPHGEAQRRQAWSCHPVHRWRPGCGHGCRGSLTFQPAELVAASQAEPRIRVCRLRWLFVFGCQEYGPRGLWCGHGEPVIRRKGAPK